MKRFLIVESRDPFEAASFASRNRLPGALAGDAEVTVFLVENAVLAARATAGTGALGTLRAAGVQVFADEFALQERGIAAERLAPGVEAAGMDRLLAELGRGAKAIWC
jgi:predicted peroxiredoxin